MFNSTAQDVSNAKAHVGRNPRSGFRRTMLDSTVRNGSRAKGGITFGGSTLRIAGLVTRTSMAVLALTLRCRAEPAQRIPPHDIQSCSTGQFAPGRWNLLRKFHPVGILGIASHRSLTSRLPIRFTSPAFNIVAKTRMRPIDGSRRQPMLDRIEMNIVHVSLQVVLVANLVFPIPALPDSTLAPFDAG